MPVKIVEQCVDRLRTYGEIPIAFTVDSQYRVDAIDRGRGGWKLVEERVEPPYVKDYDEEGERPLRWLKRWDIANWAVLAAMRNGSRLGGAVVAWNTPGVNMLEGRDDLAVLWDLRVHPDHRREGIGKRLFDHAAAWARAKGVGNSISRRRTSTCGRASSMPSKAAILGPSTRTPILSFLMKSSYSGI